MIFVSCNWFCLVQIYQGRAKSLGLLNVIDIIDDKDSLSQIAWLTRFSLQLIKSNDCGWNSSFLIFQIVLKENNTSTTTIFVRSRQQIISLGSVKWLYLTKIHNIPGLFFAIRPAAISTFKWLDMIILKDEIFQLSKYFLG